MKHHAEKCESKKYLDPQFIKEFCDCDGYHTFGELYEHRINLWMALCKEISKHFPVNPVWRTKKHSDGELAFGGDWFVLGMYEDNNSQITYHLPIEKWEECSFAEELEKAPEWDGHTSDDVLKRLKNL